MYRLTITSVAHSMGVAVHDLLEMRFRAASLWRTVDVEIRGKVRQLQVPLLSLKRLQRRLLTHVLTALPLHPVAYCAKGLGAIAAAKHHAQHPYLLHLDIASFFPSVRRQRVVEALLDERVEPACADVLACITTVGDQLPLGAPTSVYLCNLVLKPMDRRIGGLTRAIGLACSRYVDDIAVSGGRRLAHIEARIRRIAEDDGWTIGSKGGLVGPGERHTYLGLRLNSQPSVAPEYVDDLRLMISRIERGLMQLTPAQQRSLLGKTAFVAKLSEPQMRLLNRLRALQRAA